ncbi:MAG TPA: menaquinone biosynthesis protein [Puia sp.]
MDRKIRVGAVSYLNTKPLLYGIERSPLLEKMELITDYPASIAALLLKDEIDIGLVPVAIIPEMKEYHINTRYVIGCNGPVASVCLFSAVPVEKLETVLLDYQSRTSVALVKILLREYWKINPVFKEAGPGFQDEIKDSVGAVMIGDRALKQRSVSAYTYDLGEAWKKMTGLPFVFAAWISNKKLDPEWVSAFDQANGVGVHHIDQVLEGLDNSLFNLKKYYTQYLSYELDPEKEKGMQAFLEMMRR